MEIVPVLDVMGGAVVHGQAGDRDLYRPVRSTLVSVADPPAVAAALCDATACEALYMADLDVIVGGRRQLDVLSMLAAGVDAAVWVDAAITAASEAADVLTAGAARAVVGTETLPALGALAEIRAAVPDERILLSLDVGDDGVLSASPELRGMQPVAALDALGAGGLGEVMVLTLRRVGTATGPDLLTLGEVRRVYPDLGLVAGGGVRSVDDLAALQALGIDAVLVATALHRGSITAAQLKAFRSH
jgi:phosphoribosylformimino-5-aminoimidazole carboxamide ribotide isomerase